ncbi:MAG: transketolase [Coriobacteriia bacterium]|nr:transketolase [Coriobacteriia bacterium]
MSDSAGFSAFDAPAVRARAARMRVAILKMLTAAGSGHPGGSLSAADMLATLFFAPVLEFDASRLEWPERDRFILSKGHAAPVLYATLAELGLIEADELATLRRLGSRLQGHPDASQLPGVEVSTGSLGQGLSISAGLALGLRLDFGLGATARLPRVFTVLGDGELQEGQVWEAAQFAANYQLENLCALIDRNMLQIDGPTEEVMALGDVAAKFASFGWEAVDVDGHDVEALYGALSAPPVAGKPRVIVAHTHKGEGVSFMRDQAGWHGIAPTEEQCAQACAEICSCADWRDE